MRQKKLLEVPDDIFEALGFTLPKNVPIEYQKGNSITDYVGKGRIISLRKEHTYQKVYSSMNSIGLLNLNFQGMPEEDYKQVDYVLQVIGRYIKNALISIHKDNALGTNAEAASTAFIQDILGSYKEELLVSHVNLSSGYAAEIACKTFRLPSCYCIRFNSMGGETVYGAVGIKRKRREGYYYFRGNHTYTAHIIDLVDLLSKIFLFSEIYQIRTSIKLPLVQNVFEEYLNEGIKKEVEREQHMFAESIRQKNLFPLNGLSRTYTDNSKGSFYLDRHSYAVADAVFIFRKVLEIYHDISYENRHRSEISRSIATAYITKKISLSPSGTP